jgi:hypothetical protein
MADHHITRVVCFKQGGQPRQDLSLWPPRAAIWPTLLTFAPKDRAHLINARHPFPVSIPPHLLLLSRFAMSATCECSSPTNRARFVETLAAFVRWIPCLSHTYNLSERRPRDEFYGDMGIDSPKIASEFLNLTWAAWAAFEE